MQVFCWRQPHPLLSFLISFVIPPQDPRMKAGRTSTKACLHVVFVARERGRRNSRDKRKAKICAGSLRRSLFWTKAKWKQGEEERDSFPLRQRWKNILYVAGGFFKLFARQFSQCLFARTWQIKSHQPLSRQSFFPLDTCFVFFVSLAFMQTPPLRAFHDYACDENDVSSLSYSREDTCKLARDGKMQWWQPI